MKVIQIAEYEEVDCFWKFRFIQGKTVGDMEDDIRV